MALAPEELQRWLEWAGARLLALPVGRIKPRDDRCVWPEIVPEPEDLETAPARALRVAPPTADEIPIMDEILLLPNLCADHLRRRTLHARALVNPLNGKHLFKWARIGRLLQTDGRTVRGWHRAGLAEVCKVADRSVVYRLSLFFQLDITRP